MLLDCFTCDIYVGCGTIKVCFVQTLDTLLDWLCCFVCLMYICCLLYRVYYRTSNCYVVLLTWV